MITFKQFLYENESTELAKDYINYARDGDLSGTEFVVNQVEGGQTQVTIYQETDESEDGLEEATKYRVFQGDVPVGIWKQFMAVVDANT